MGIIWQDIVLSVGGFLFAVALIPTIRAKEKPAILSSAMTASILTVYLGCFATLGLWLAFVSGILCASCWWILMIQALRRNS